MRVLIVEDEFLVGEALYEFLMELGHTPVGPAVNVREALELLRTGTIDCALLDVKLGNSGEVSIPVADELRARKIPFAVLSGYARDAGMANRYGDAPWLSKPADYSALRSVLTWFATAHKREDAHDS